MFVRIFTCMGGSECGCATIHVCALWMRFSPHGFVCAFLSVFVCCVHIFVCIERMSLCLWVYVPFFLCEYIFVVLCASFCQSTRVCVCFYACVGVCASLINSWLRQAFILKAVSFQGHLFTVCLRTVTTVSYWPRVFSLLHAENSSPFTKNTLIQCACVSVQA